MAAMRATYKVLAHLVAGLVAIQAGIMVFAVAGLYSWVADGNSLTESVLTSEEPPEFTGAIGFMLHGMVGMMLIPAIAIALLVVSFSKVQGGIRWAAIVLGLTALQIVLGIAGHATPYAGLLHGLNALAAVHLRPLRRPRREDRAGRSDRRARGRRLPVTRKERVRLGIGLALTVAVLGRSVGCGGPACPAPTR